MKRFGNIWLTASRLLSVLFIVVSSASLANEPFKILRSQVVTLTEPDTGRAYPFYIKLPRLYANKANKRDPVVCLMVAGAKQLAQKIREIPGDNMAVKLQIVKGARHSTAFPTTLIQGLDWTYGQSR